MPKKPNIAALAEEWLSPDEGESKGHPLQSVIKDEFPGRIVFIPVDLLFPNPDQPRQHFDEEALKDLAASIKDKGILQPVIARKDKTGDGYIQGPGKVAQLFRNGRKSCVGLALSGPLCQSGPTPVS